MDIILKKYIYLILSGCLIGILTFNSCRHLAVDFEDVVPQDTTKSPIDTMGGTVDTSDMAVPCEEDIIYFSKDVLPIFQSNCAFSGCHDATSAKDGVILESYQSVMATADIKAFNLDDNEIIEVLVEKDSSKRMPPVPRLALSANHIQLISEWILQGAEDFECDPNIQGCNTDQVTYSTYVKSLLNSHCVGCHGNINPSGGINLSSYNSVKTVASNGKLFGAVNHDSGYKAMPQGGNKLSPCDRDKLKAWIDDGSKNN